MHAFKLIDTQPFHIAITEILLKYLATIFQDTYIIKKCSLLLTEHSLHGRIQRLATHMHIVAIIFLTYPHYVANYIRI